jgi:hypothetical protein
VGYPRCAARGHANRSRHLGDRLGLNAYRATGIILANVERMAGVIDDRMFVAVV